MPSNAAAPGVHPPNEQYLEAILYLEEEGSQVIQARLAEHDLPDRDRAKARYQRHPQAPLG